MIFAYSDVARLFAVQVPSPVARERAEGEGRKQATPTLRRLVIALTPTPAQACALVRERAAGEGAEPSCGCL